MQTSERIDYIKNWIIDYCKSMPKEPDSLIIGISGGVDSSVTSTICALTGKKTIVLSMPIKQIKEQYNLSLKHQEWLKKNYKNIETLVVPLDTIFKDFQIALSNFNSLHGFANSRARLRMTTLYQIAQSNNGLVVGTGNKVEDFGVGFYTKYGDGGVDISPIGDCTKTEIWEMGGELGIIKQIIDAVPTDGLWDDARSDENQLGLSYEQIEAAMSNSNSKYYKKYLKIREPNLHKIKPIPVCKIKKNVKQ
jgi:NAD+ synthase